jgi:hypothetical protein
VAEKSNGPTTLDQQQLERLAAFIITSADVGLMFSRGPQQSSVDKAIEFMGSSDAAWCVRPDGKSRLGHSVKLLPSTSTDNRSFDAVVMARSGIEKGVVSGSATVCELKAALNLTSTVMAYRSIAEEIAGIADNTTTELVPPGAPTPTAVNAKQSNATISNHITSPPTTTIQDNASLLIAIRQDVSKQGRALKSISRWVNQLKTQVAEGLVHPVQVGSKQQQANPLTKNNSSPTVYWREAEWLQGTQPAIIRMQQEAADYGRRKTTPQRLGEMVAAPSND